MSNFGKQAEQFLEIADKYDKHYEKTKMIWQHQVANNYRVVARKCKKNAELYDKEQND